MATQKGVWDLQEVRDKQLASAWNYSAPGDPNRLMAWGKNDMGSLGLNQPINTAYSSPVSIPGQWTKVYTAFDAKGRFAAQASGTLYGWGWNDRGQLGQNDDAHRSSPTQIGTETTWNEVYGSEYGVIATKTDGTLWQWGSNTYGELGKNDRVQRSSPTQVGTDTTWTKGVAGALGVQAIKSNGTLWAWGRNWRGGAGLNDKISRSSPTQVGTNTNWKTIYGNGGGFGASKTDGTQWVWGRAWGGGLGQNQGGNNDDASYSSPVQIPGTDWAIVQNIGSVGFATKTDGTFWSWGYQPRGSLGQNNTIQSSSPVQVGTDTNWPKADADFFNMRLVPSLRFAIKTDSTLWTWGANPYGQLGQNDIAMRSSPTQIPGTWDQVDGTGWDGSVIAKSPS